MIETQTPSGNATFQFGIDTVNQKIVINTGNSEHSYRLDAIRELYLWLKSQDADKWIELGSKGIEEHPNAGSVESWARSEDDLLSSRYGLTRGREGRFASYIPSILKLMGFIEFKSLPNANGNTALHCKAI